MNCKQMKYIMKSGIQMYQSLLVAIDKAGGCGYSIDEICEMSVMDLISKLATNNIRFTYIIPESKIEKEINRKRDKE